MALTRDFKETVAARVQKDPAFAQALLDEAITLFVNGEPEPAKLILRDVATGQEQSGQTNDKGQYVFTTKTTGTFLLIVQRDGFAEAARTLVVENADATLDVPVQLELGSVSTEVTVTAARSAREVRHIPLNIDVKSSEQILQGNSLSTGTALAETANINAVGDGPFGVRPRLRGLDSTRLLVLVDGERMNTARLATNRAGAETGLVSPDEIGRAHV